MWARGAAIRPVPPYAVVSRSILDQVERVLSEEGEAADRELEQWLE